MTDMNTTQTQSPAEIARYLKGADFPADKQTLLDRARDNGAGSDILDTIEQMPDGEFQTMADVMRGVGDGGRGASNTSMRQ